MNTLSREEYNNRTSIVHSELLAVWCLGTFEPDVISVLISFWWTALYLVNLLKLCSVVHSSVQLRILCTTAFFFFLIWFLLFLSDGPYYWEIMDSNSLHILLLVSLINPYHIPSQVYFSSRCSTSFQEYDFWFCSYFLWIFPL